MEVRMVNGSSGDLLDCPVFFQADVPGQINLARAPRPYHLKQLIFSKENGVRECAPPFFQYHLSGIILIQFFLIYNSCLSKFPKNFLKIDAESRCLIGNTAARFYFPYLQSPFSLLNKSLKMPCCRAKAAARHYSPIKYSNRSSAVSFLPSSMSSARFFKYA